MGHILDKPNLTLSDMILDARRRALAAIGEHRADGASRDSIGDRLAFGNERSQIDY